MPSLILRLTLVSLLLAAPVGAAAAPLRVVVSIPPLAWFVEQVAGDLAEVDVLLGPGDSPATYEPTPRRLAALATADLFLGAGVPCERGLRPRIAAMSPGPRLAGPAPAADAGGDGHGHGAALDPHVWLAPAGAAALGDTVLAALTALAPAHRERFAAGRARLDSTIGRVDADVRALLAGRRGAVFVVFHPAFGHFAAAYGLRQLALEDDGHEPSGRHLAEVTATARAHGVRAVVVQPQFSRRAAEAAASALGVPVVDLDPLARDWAANLRHVAAVLAEVSGTASPPRGGS